MRPFVLTLLSVPFAVPLLAADWPQWMGPNRDDVWPEVGIADKFPPGGPKVLWRHPVGGGYSGPAVVDGRVYITDKQMKPGVPESKDPFDRTKIPATERVLCLDAKTGAELWRHEYDCPYQISYPTGPRCTPTVSGGKVYTLGAMGHLCCLDAVAGPKKIYWQKHLPTDLKAAVPMWGFTGHPIVYKNLLICVGGGEAGVVVAFDKDTGAVKWQALHAPEPGYCSPALIEAGGVTQLVVWTPKQLCGLNPADGKTYWQVPLVPKHAMSIMSPRRHGDYLYTGGIGNVGVVLKLDPTRPAVTEVWRNPDPNKPKAGIYPVNMTPFIDHGVIYGVDQPGMLRAAELTTGKRLWATFKPVLGEEKANTEEFRGGGSGTAFLVKNGDRFFIFAETGDLIIAKLGPDSKAGYHELARAHLLDRTGGAFGRKVVWSHPAFANKCVFARNDKEIVCASLAAE